MIDTAGWVVVSDRHSLWRSDSLRGVDRPAITAVFDSSAAPVRAPDTTVGAASAAMPQSVDDGVADRGHTVRAAGLVEDPRVSPSRTATLPHRGPKRGRTPIAATCRFRSTASRVAVSDRQRLCRHHRHGVHHPAITDAVRGRRARSARPRRQRCTTRTGARMSVALRSSGSDELAAQEPSRLAPARENG
jgi:hypothetical protein